MKAKEAIEKIALNGGIIVYELYNFKRKKKCYEIYKSYVECVVRNSFSLDEFTRYDDITDLDEFDFYHGVIISETRDNEWGIIATLLQ